MESLSLSLSIYTIYIIIINYTQIKQNWTVLDTSGQNCQN